MSNFSNEEMIEVYNTLQQRGVQLASNQVYTNISARPIALSSLIMRPAKLGTWIRCDLRRLSSVYCASCQRKTVCLIIASTGTSSSSVTLRLRWAGSRASMMQTTRHKAGVALAMLHGTRCPRLFHVCALLDKHMAIGLPRKWH